MPKGETIGSKLQLDGEQEYKKALNDAYRSLKVLRSELKAETAELGRNATQQDKARTKIASLQKQIEQQQKVVKTLEKALSDSKKEYADNQEVQDKWAEKLNKARAALAEMQNQLGTAEDSLKDFNSSMKDAADSSGQAMSTVISFNDAMKSIGSIASGIGESLSGIFTSTAETMREMVEEMYSLMSLAWSAAGEWKEIQTIWGGDLESIEKVYTAMGLQGIDAGQVTSGIQKFITNVHNGNKDTMAALKELGLTEGMFEDHWSFFTAVMDEASGRENKFDLARALFGDKKGAEATNILDNWSDAMGRYQKDVEETGQKLYSSEIEELDKVSHRITEIQFFWNVIKRNIGAKLSEVLNIDQISEDALEILRDIGSLLNGDGDKKEITIKLSSDIETLIKDISAAMGNLAEFLGELGGDLEKSENPLVRFVGQLISSLSGILSWISENSDVIIGWLNKLLPLMVTNKISEATTGKGIGEWVTDIIKLGLEVKVLGTAFGGAAGAAIGSSGAATALGTGIGATLLSALETGLPALLLGIPMVDMLLHPEKYQGEKADEVKQLEEATDPLSILKESDGGKNALQWAFGGGTSQGGNVPMGETVDIRRTPNGQVLKLTPEQETAAQIYWDLLRGGNDSIYDWDAFKDAFIGQETTFEKLNEMINSQLEKDRTVEDLPSSWFAEISGALQTLVNGGNKSESDDTLPARMGAAVEKGIAKKPTQVTVILDGQVIKEYIDQSLGSELAGLFG